MPPIQRILFPTDFSASARLAEQQACTQARAHGAELHLVFVAEDASAVYPDATTEYLLPLSMSDALVSAKAELLKHPDPQWADGLQIVREVCEGSPPERIVRYAKEHGIGLIVLGTHGRKGLRHLLLGSTAEQVVRMAPCPVTVVRPQS